MAREGLSVFYDVDMCWLAGPCVVMATDVDSVTNSQLTYSVSDANFTVQTVNNIGYIRTAQSVLYYVELFQPHSALALVVPCFHNFWLQSCVTEQMTV